MRNACGIQFSEAIIHATTTTVFSIMRTVALGDFADAADARREVLRMADLSEYESFNGVEFRQDVRAIMELFTESWEECRGFDCGTCKYRHGKEMYQILACLSERYAEKLISNGFCQLRNGSWVLGEVEPGCFMPGGNRPWICSECGQVVSWMLGSPQENYCPNCGAKMDLKEGAEK